MARIPIALAAGAAALTTAAVIATSGSAQAPTPTTLHFVTKSVNSVGFGPGAHHKPVPGDRFGFGAKYTGDDVGYDRGVCTIVGTGSAFALCTVQVHLSKGTLSAQGLTSGGRNKNTPFAITGGTGAYDGARGTALVTDVNSNTSNIDVTLKP